MGGPPLLQAAHSFWVWPPAAYTAPPPFPPPPTVIPAKAGIHRRPTLTPPPPAPPHYHSRHPLIGHPPTVIPAKAGIHCCPTLTPFRRPTFPAATAYAAPPPFPPPPYSSFPRKRESTPHKPATAGNRSQRNPSDGSGWIPAFAGMTIRWCGNNDGMGGGNDGRGRE